MPIKCFAFSCSTMQSVDSTYATRVSSAAAAIYGDHLFMGIYGGMHRWFHTRVQKPLSCFTSGDVFCKRVETARGHIDSSVPSASFVSNVDTQPRFKSYNIIHNAVKERVNLTHSTLLTRCY